MANKTCIANKRYTIEANGERIEYTLVKSKRKTIGITIYEDGRVRISVPFSASEKYIQEELQSKADWIIKKVREIRSKNSAAIQRRLIDGEKILYLGREYELKIEEKIYNCGEVVLNENTMTIAVSLTPLFPEEIKHHFIKGALKKWYAQRFCEIAQNRIHKFSSQIGVKVNKVSIKDQKTRWGSCSKKGNISLNWRLVMSPESVIDYVVVHELCHLKVMNHSKEFWDLVASILPDYIDRRKWLKANGETLRI